MFSSSAVFSGNENSAASLSPAGASALSLSLGFSKSSEFTELPAMPAPTSPREEEGAFTETQNGGINISGNKEKKDILKSLWWVFVVVAGVIAAAIFFIIFMLKRRKDKEEEEAAEDDSKSIDVNMYPESDHSEYCNNPLFNTDRNSNDPFDDMSEEEI